MAEQGADGEAGLGAYPAWLVEAVQMAPVGIHVTDAAGACLLVNRRWSEITGLPAEAALGSGWTRMFDAGDGRRLLDDWLAPLRDGKAVSRQVPLITADGQRRWAHCYTMPVARPGGGLIGAIGLIADITEQHELAQAYETLVEHSLQGYLIFQDGITVFANRAMTDLTGYSNAELREAPLDVGLARIHPDDREWVMAYLAEYAAGRGTPDRLEMRIVRKDGQVRWLELGIGHIEYRGRPALQVVYLDVTERRVYADGLKRANAELERRVAERTARLEGALREIESFSYSVSHDLRAPLRAIDGFSQGLLEDYAGALDERGRDYLLRVRRAARHMGELIDDLLALSRVVRSDLVRAPLDLTSLAHEVVDDLQRGRPGPAATVRIAPGLRAEGDRALLRALLVNLLGNALKFSSRETAPRVEFAAAPDAGLEPVFVVRDNGVGFDMAYVEKLFLPFQRLHGPEEFEGSGIGLATVQRIVARHGGRVWAESAPGAGAAFYFTLA